VARFANIGPVERRKRHRTGVLSILMGVAFAFMAWASALPLAARALCGIFFFIGFVGVFQARAHTCVALARFGMRNPDSSPEKIDDPAELAAVRAQSRAVLLRSLVATLVLTAVALALQ
jgi:hypothetical protein